MRPTKPLYRARTWSSVAVDQAVSSGTNFIATAWAARLLTADEFGPFALVQAAAVFAVGLCRAGLAETAVVSATRPRRSDGAWCALVAALCVLVPVLFVSVSITLPAIGILSVLLAVSCWGEVLRTWHLSRGQAVRSLVFDVTWLLLTALALWAVAEPNFVSVMTAWLGAGAVSAGVTTIAFRRDIESSGTGRGPLFLHLGAEHLVGGGMQPVMLGLLGGLFSLGTAGTVRLLMLAFSPIHMLFSTIRPLMLDPRRSIPEARMVSMAFALTVVAWGVGLTALAGPYLAAALGAAWDNARDHLPAWTLYAVGSAIAAGPSIVLRRRGRGGVLVGIRVIASLQVPVSLLGFRWIVGGTEAAGVWAAAVAGLVGGLVWLFAGFRAVKSSTDVEPSGAVTCRTTKGPTR